MKKRMALVATAFLLITVLITACGQSAASVKETTVPEETTIPVIDVFDLDYSIEFQGNTIDGKYSGQTVNGLPEGQGTFASNDGTFSYDGQWSEGKISGKGSMKCDGFKITVYGSEERIGSYEGDVVDGKAEGTGTFASKNTEGVGWIYEGEWKSGLMDGQGKLTFEEYEGRPSEIQKGTYTAGDYTPTVREFMEYCAGYQDGEDFIITDTAKDFLDKYPDIFVNNSTDGSDAEYDDTYAYEEYSKNNLKFGDRLVWLGGMTVRQILEDEIYGYKYTFVLASDSAGHYYYGFKMGWADGIYDGSYVNMTILPLNFFYFTSTTGVEVPAVGCAIVSMELAE